MLARVLSELFWSSLFIALCVLGLFKLLRIPRERSEALGITLGAAVGIACALALAMLVGPFVSTPVIPLLPLFATIGAINGFLYTYPGWKSGPKCLQSGMCLAIVALLWPGFYLASNLVAEREAFRVVVVKQSERAGPTRWGTGGISIDDLTVAERAMVEGSVGMAAGTLTPVSSFAEGRSPQASVVLVMFQDVSQPVKLRMPDKGTVAFLQEKNGTWREVPGRATFSNRSLALQPDAASSFTHITVGSPFGTQSFEAAVSHQ